MDNLPSKPLTDKQKAFIVKKLALKRPYTEIKQDFTVFFEQPVSGNQIMDIEENFSPLIQQVSREEMNKLWDEPLAHARNRLGFAYEALQEARRQRIVVPAQRISESEWSQPFSGMDLKNIYNFLQLARAEEYFAKKLMLEVKRLKLEEEKEELLSSSFKTIEINTGIEEDE